MAITRHIALLMMMAGWFHFMLHRNFHGQPQTRHGREAGSLNWLLTRSFATPLLQRRWSGHGMLCRAPFAGIHALGQSPAHYFMIDNTSFSGSCKFLFNGRSGARMIRRGAPRLIAFFSHYAFLATQMAALRESFRVMQSMKCMPLLGF